MMARPQKQGMDYFSVDVTFDDNMDYIIAEHGAEGLGIVIGLFQKIYREGYYIEWNKKALSLFSQRINAGKDAIEKVVDSCFEENIFSKKLYEEYGILTSRGIQNRYLKMCKDCKRKNVTINRNYLLDIDSELTGVITELTGVNEEETLVNSENSTQSKVKESKVKYIKEDVEEKEENSAAAPEPIIDLNFKRVIDIFNQNIHPVTPIEAEKINYWLKDFEADAIIIAIGEAVENNARTIKYIEAVLNSWNSKGLKTKNAVEAYLRDRQKKKNNKQEYKPNVRIPGASSNQRKYDGDELERMLLGRNKF